MTHTYHISGMTCNGCVAKVKTALLKIGDITSAEVQLTAPQAAITMQKHIPLQQLQSAISATGAFTITEADGGMHSHTVSETNGKTWLQTYKPLLLVFFYLVLVTFLATANSAAPSVMTAMPIFMGGFFLIFSFFKLLDLKGFAGSYAGYDIIAKKWYAWGYIYPFVELLLGIAFVTNYQPAITNLATLVVMGLSIIGVLQSVWNKRKIQCACLGTGFNLPMSTVTIIEDGLMIAMSAVMLTGIL